MVWSWNVETLLVGLPIAILGASIGSFLNVVIYRVPRQLSLLKPGSHCPVCKTPLGPRENVPIVGWLLLRGRCRHCGTAISPRYPGVEALTMGLYLLCFAVWGLSGTTFAAALFLSWLLSLALIDLDTYLLPESLTRSGLVAGLAMRCIAPILADQGSAPAIAGSVVAGVGGAVLGILGLELIGIIGRLVFRKDAMGLGDGKLMAAIGMCLGWQAVVVTVFVGCLSGVLGSAVGMSLRRIQLGRPIPFGPYLALGGAISLFAAPQIVRAYLSFAGLAV